MISWEDLYGISTFIAATLVVVTLLFFGYLFPMAAEPDPYYLTCNEIDENDTFSYSKFENESKPIYNVSEAEDVQPRIRELLHGEDIQVNKTYYEGYDEFFVRNGSDVYNCLKYRPGSHI